MDNSIRNYIGAICLWVSAPDNERRETARTCMSHYFEKLTSVHGTDWPLIVDASFEAKKAIGEGFSCIEAIDVAFRRLQALRDGKD